MNLDVLADLEALDQLKGEWDQLYEKCGARNIFASHRWVSSCLRTFGTEGLQALIVRANDGQLVAVLPLRLRSLSMRGARWRALVHACERSTDYGAFLVDPNANMRLAVKKIIDAVEQLADQWDFVLLANLTDDHAPSNLLRVMLGERLYGGSLVSSMAPLVRLDEPHEEHSASRRVVRRFDKARRGHDVAVHIDAPPTPELLESLRTLHQQTFPDQGFNTAANQTLYRELIECPEFASKTEFSWIEIDGNVAAGHFGFKGEGKVYYYVPAFDQRYAEFGVGQYLLMAMIGHYREAGFDEFDFLRGTERYKFRWANGVRTNHLLFGALRQGLTARKRLFANLWMSTRSLPLFADAP